MDIKTLCTEAHKTACEKGWYDDCPGPLTVAMVAEKLCLMHAEISEALEELRKAPLSLQAEEGEKIPVLGHCYESATGKPEGYLIEIADLLIRTGDLIAKAGLTDHLVNAIEVKMAYNKTRPRRHGGKHC